MAFRNRRAFLKAGSASLLAAGSPVFWAEIHAAARQQPASERVRLAAVGVGGKGWSDINSVSVGHDVVAFCDIDEASNRRKGGWAAAAEQWPKARRYSDWRKMLDREFAHLDGITISTPDHMHAPVTMTAMQLGLSVYTQKPLTRTVHESRQLTREAARRDVVTQMGNQNHSGAGYRTLVELVRSGVIGKIREAHSWSNRPIWPQGIDRPTSGKAAPDNLQWDLWLGVAPHRPYVASVYHPFNWRGWFDFGAGALGDMGCHIIDPVFWSLELQAPRTVQYSGPAVNAETFPTEETIVYEFAPTRWTTDGSMILKWYDGGRLPDASLAQLPKGKKLPRNGCLLIGEKGCILTKHGSLPQVLPEEKFADAELPRLESVDHYLQWTNAIRGEGKTSSGFDYAGPLTETVLLGTIAPRFPQTALEWIPEEMRFRNSSEADRFLRQPYRRGWEVAGL